jgi:hypothetical protein
MRGFPSTASREAPTRGFREGRLWNERPERVLLPMLGRYDVVVVDAPAGVLACGMPCPGCAAEGAE